MEKSTKQKGITLIALIITIIVMLILVGVTINVALNGGLFDKAKTAAEQTQKQADREELLSAIIGTYDSITKNNLVNGLSSSWTVVDNKNGTITCTSPKGNVFYVYADTGVISEEEPIVSQSITLDKSTLKLSLTGEKTQGSLTATIPGGASIQGWTSSDTNIATITGSGTNVTINAVANGKAIITAKLDETHSATCNVIIGTPAETLLQAGDYIKYDEDDDGNSEDWIVFYDNSDGYGLQLISKSPRTGINLSGLDGYNNNISLLNAKCADYAKGEGTQSYRAAGTHPLFANTGDTTTWFTNSFISGETIKSQNTDVTDFTQFQTLISSFDFSSKQTFTVAGRVANSYTEADPMDFGVTCLDVTKNPPNRIVVLYTIGSTGTPTSGSTTGYDNLFPIVVMEEGMYIISGDGSSSSPYQYEY